MEIPVTNMKLLVIGHGRHGKDTVSEILNEKYDLSFESSSRFCSKLFIFNELKDKFGYETEEQCYADRHSHRELWYNMICEYNQNDPSRLGREIFKEHDIYCGLRNKREFHAIKNNNAVDFSICPKTVCPSNLGWQTSLSTTTAHWNNLKEMLKIYTTT
jgi:hypothetical protein